MGKNAEDNRILTQACQQATPEQQLTLLHQDTASHPDFAAASDSSASSSSSSSSLSSSLSTSSSSSTSQSSPSSSELFYFFRTPSGRASMCRRVRYGDSCCSRNGTLTLESILKRREESSQGPSDGQCSDSESIGRGCDSAAGGIAVGSSTVSSAASSQDDDQRRIIRRTVSWM